jgi:hypothetical protein
MLNTDNDTKKWFEEKNKKMIKSYPFHKQPHQNNSYYDMLSVDNISLIFSKLWSKKSIQLNYDNLSKDYFIKEMKKIFNNKEINKIRDKDVIVPIMSIGHVKAVQNMENIKRILNGINTAFKDNLIYWTLRDAIIYWRDEVLT